jgi:hypothetical protein
VNSASRSGAIREMGVWRTCRSILPSNLRPERCRHEPDGQSSFLGGVLRYVKAECEYKREELSDEVFFGFFPRRSHNTRERNSILFVKKRLCGSRIRKMRRN